MVTSVPTLGLNDQHVHTAACEREEDTVSQSPEGRALVGTSWWASPQARRTVKVLVRWRRCLILESPLTLLCPLSK